MTYVILEYEQDEKEDATFKSEGTHPLFYTESDVMKYVKKNDIHGKVEEYDDSEYGDYINDESDEIPEPMRIIEW